MNNTNNNDILLYKAKSPLSISSPYILEKYKQFDRTFAFTYKPLSNKNKNKEEKLKEKCWEALTNLVIFNYNLKKATKINKFGTFTFINSNETKINNLYLSQNGFVRNIPMFLVSNDFISHIKPAVYEDKNGLILFTNKKYSINNNIEVLNINYTKLSKDINIPKEEFEKIIMEIIDDIKDKIKLQIFNAKKMEGLGIFLMRRNLFGMRFENNNIYNFNFFPKKIRLKRNLIKFNKIKNEYENDKNLFSKTNDNSDSLIKSSILNPKNYKLIKNENKTLYQKINENKNEDKKCANNTLRNFSLLKLKSMKIDQRILDDIYNKKELLLQKINEGIYNDILISKESFIKWFLEINNSLDFETANKIINIYDNHNNGNKFEYYNIIKNLFNDIKTIIKSPNLILYIIIPLFDLFTFISFNSVHLSIIFNTFIN